MNSIKTFRAFLLLAFLTSCVSVRHEAATSCMYARYFDVLDEPVAVVTISPHNGTRDTLLVGKPLDNIICMSSSDVAALSAIGADSVISAVSGLRYISDPDVHQRNVPDVGYEAYLDYEEIVKINPDLVVAYAVSGAEPQYVAKLRELGVPVLMIYSHLEFHPLARAEYVCLFGALTDREEEARRFFDGVRSRYDSLVLSCPHEKRVKVLLNAPYGEAWYVPGEDSYMTRIIYDAGGEVLGARKGQAASSVISLEDAYVLSQEADVWLNPGHCRSIDELASIHEVITGFGPVVHGKPVYNNILKSTPGGGNDFWESGAVRPDMVLEDLRRILSLSEDKTTAENLNYFVQLNK